jgi:hypothetical protein
MKTINFKFDFTDLHGIVDPSVDTASTVAQILAKGSSAKPQRTMELARAIIKKGTIDLLSEDEQLIINAVVMSDRNDLFKCQVMELLEKSGEPEPAAKHQPATPQPAEEDDLADQSVEANG